MKAIATGLLAMLALAGCAASRPVETSLGKPSYHVDCPPTRRDLCYSKAAQLCPKGYDELKQDIGPLATTAPTSAGNAGSASAKTAPNSLLIACK